LSHAERLRRTSKDLLEDVTVDTLLGSDALERLLLALLLKSSPHELRPHSLLDGTTRTLSKPTGRIGSSGLLLGHPLLFRGQPRASR
jgi:hypothetical protein